MTTGHSEAEPFWVEFLRGLRGVKLVISDAHEGLKAAIGKIFSATWQRCRVHFMRNALAYAGKTQKRAVSAWVGTAFAQDDAASAHKQWRDVADQMRPRLPKLAGLLDEAEADVLAYMDFPSQHRAEIHSTNPLERLNGEIKRAPTSSASSPTTTPWSGSSAPCCSSRTMNGQPSAPDT